MYLSNLRVLFVVVCKDSCPVLQNRSATKLLRFLLSRVWHQAHHCPSSVYKYVGRPHWSTAPFLVHNSSATTTDDGQTVSLCTGRQLKSTQFSPSVFPFRKRHPLLRRECRYTPGSCAPSLRRRTALMPSKRFSLSTDIACMSTASSSWSRRARSRALSLLTSDRGVTSSGSLSADEAFTFTPKSARRRLRRNRPLCMRSAAVFASLPTLVYRVNFSSSSSMTTVRSNSSIFAAIFRLCREKQIRQKKIPICNMQYAICNMHENRYDTKPLMTLPGFALLVLPSFDLLSFQKPSWHTVKQTACVSLSGSIIWC